VVLRSLLTASTLSSGMRSPHASSKQTCLVTASATRWLSPEMHDHAGDAYGT